MREGVESSVFGPPPRDSERSEYFWSGIPNELRGKKVDSLDELRSVFGDRKIGIVDFRKGRFGGMYAIYGALLVEDEPTSFVEHLAYRCPNCEDIVIGPPMFENYNEIGLLAGARGYRINCGSCGLTIDDVEIMRALSG